MGAEETGERFKESGEERTARYQVPRTGEFSWRSFFDPEFYAVNITETLPTSLSLLPVAVVGAYAGGATATAAGLGAFGRFILASIVGGTTSRTVESAFEAAQQYDAALEKGATDEEAEQQAQQVFKENLLLAGSDIGQIALVLAPVRGGGALRTAMRAGAKVVGEPVMEAVEEGVQEIIQRRAAGEPISFDPQMQEAMASGAIIGVTCHASLELAQTAQDEGASYVAFGRLFDSNTKPEAPPADLNILRKAKEVLDIPVCAIGGITPDNAPGLIEGGADMLAVIHGVFGQSDVTAAAERYARLFTFE